jgi:hypothetical protein
MDVQTILAVVQHVTKDVPMTFEQPNQKGFLDFVGNHLGRICDYLFVAKSTLFDFLLGLLDLLLVAFVLRPTEVHRI